MIEFYLEVVQALNEINAPYMIVGAFGASSYGLTRSTMDVDIIVDLRDENCEALARKFPPPRFYADPEQMRESIQLGIMFNLIDGNRGTKADLVPLSREPEYREAFARRVLLNFEGPNQTTFEAWCAQAEDIIIGKLMAWDEGRSLKHANDISAMLDFDAHGMSEQPLNLSMISARAVRISPDAAKLWQELVRRAYAKH